MTSRLPSVPLPCPLGPGFALPLNDHFTALPPCHSVIILSGTKFALLSLFATGGRPAADGRLAAADFSADVGRPILLYVTPGTTGTPLRTRTDTVRVGLVGPAGCSFPTPTSLTPSHSDWTTDKRHSCFGARFR